MSNEPMKPLSGEVLEEEVELTLGELCRISELPAETVFELVEYGVIEPRGREPERWRFGGIAVRRVRRAQRLQEDLGVNVAGVALALELLDELEQVRSRLRRLEA